MIDFSFFWLPFVVIGVVNFFISWLYYSPAVPWFRAWQVGIGMDPNKRQMSEADRKAMPRLMGGAVVASLLFSYGLQVVVHSVKATDFGTGLLDQRLDPKRVQTSVETRERQTMLLEPPRLSEGESVLRSRGQSFLLC